MANQRLEDRYLRFADDILICANTPHEQKLQELAHVNENQGLKTKAIMENDTPIYVNNTQIENVESYIYLGQRYSTRDKKDGIVAMLDVSDVDNVCV